MDWLNILEKGFWFGWAAVGFAILFNVPPRTLIPIWIMGALGGMTKLAFISFGTSVILGSLGGAILIGILSTPLAHSKHAPPLIFSIPAVIPMVPGTFAYKMMLGLMHLTEDPNSATYNQLLHETTNNGLKAFFIIMSLAVGVALPTLITRQASIKHIKLIKKKAS